MEKLSLIKGIDVKDMFILCKFILTSAVKNHNIKLY